MRGAAARCAAAGVLAAMSAAPAAADVLDYVGRTVSSVRLSIEGRVTTDPSLTQVIEVRMVDDEVAPYDWSGCLPAGKEVTGLVQQPGSEENRIRFAGDHLAECSKGVLATLRHSQRDRMVDRRNERSPRSAIE